MRSELGCTDYLRRAVVFQRLIPAAFGLRFLPLIYGEHGIDKSPTACHQSHNDKACKASLHVRQTAGPEQEAVRQYLYLLEGQSAMTAAQDEERVLARVQPEEPRFTEVK